MNDGTPGVTVRLVSHKHFCFQDVQGNGVASSMCDFREEGGGFLSVSLIPCPCVAHTPMNAVRACKSHPSAVDIHHDI